ncbi:DMT family transporter [uncultured Alsobacter sp.]|uniref:DMT family transporter n=1 Tax=uncultured Alsobacter sp. TaxID=1748258 RepID=UPI00260096BD|nr:DMT family transporter [uncultured Alsobacter sp.]
MSIRKAGRWLWQQPYLLLVLTMLMWAGNAIAGRVAIGQVSPMGLTAGRWVVACALLAVIARDAVRRDWPALRPHWLRVGILGTVGFTAFNAFYYEAAHHTTAANLTILQGAIPVFVLILAALVYRTRITPAQIAGSVLAIAGVTVLASKGDWDILRQFAFNPGDVWMVVASGFYAIYTVALRKRPPVSSLALFSAFAVAAVLTSLPLLAAEAIRGELFWPTRTGLLVILFVGIFPSLISQTFFIRAVELIGPGRAGLFSNLTPVFGPILAVLLLGEPFELYTAVSLALVIGGILIAETLGRR